MADVKVPYSEVGVAAFEKLDTYERDHLISGNWPAMSPAIPVFLKAGVTLKKFQVVGLDSAGLLDIATVGGATPIKPVGVATDVVTGAVGNVTPVNVLFGGNFNPAALAWDDSFATDALKRDAFVGAGNPTNIVITPRG